MSDFKEYAWVRHRDDPKKIGRLHKSYDSVTWSLWWDNDMFYYRDICPRYDLLARDVPETDLVVIEDQRWVPGSPLCGDVWRLKDDRHMLVDYKDSLQTGVVWSDGEAKAMGYTAGYERYCRDEGVELVLRSEDSGFPACDARGWTRGDEKWTIGDSRAFLRRVMDRGGRGDDAPCARNHYGFGEQT